MFGLGGRRYRVLEVRGIPLYVGTSWFVVAGLYLYAEYLQLSRFGDETEAWMLAALSAVLFFGGVLVHEVAHAAVARAFDVPVSAINLVFWGGATETRTGAKGPLVEFLIAFAGPASTLLLGGAFYLVSEALDPGLARAVVRDLAALNVLFAAFNALPGFPLDGGWMVMATAWGISKKRRVAMQVAGWSGVLVGAGMVAYGILQLGDANGSVWGIWLAFIGFSLFGAGRQMPRRIALRDQLGDATVGHAMRPPPEPVPATVPLSEAIDRVLRTEPERTFPVADGGRIVGTISMESARRIAERDPIRPARDAMRPLPASVTLAPDEPLIDALEWMAGRDALVLRDGQAVGTLTAADVERWYRVLQGEITVPPRPDG